jgi:hypothetical protein
LTVRARQAWAKVREWDRPTPAIPLLNPCVTTADRTGQWVKVSGGVVWLGGVQPPWPPLIPSSDGQKLLADATVSDRCQLAGQTLALEVGRGNRPAKLYLFRGPQGRLLGEYLLEPPNYLFQLSPDGRRLARQTWVRSVLVSETAGGSPVATLGWAGMHTNLSVMLTTKLTVGIGKYVHQFEWMSGTLEHAVVQTVPVPEYRPRPTVGAGASEPVPAAVTVDPKRFRRAAVSGSWSAYTDQWGQIILLDRKERVAAYVLVRRGLAAVCLPDGTRWGAPALLGGPPTPGAAESIGQALSTVWRK